MNKREYYDRVYGCWLGKSVGGTIGASFEGDKNFLSIPMEYPETMAPNDDIDLQLVWLDILRKKSFGIDTNDLAKGWKKISYPYDEFGIAIANLKLGLKPPITGYYNNWFYNCMGASMRSEIWACIAPDRPEIAGWYAYQDAIVDHWNEGVYSEIFFTCLESAAFSGKVDIEKLIVQAIAYLPEESKVKSIVNMILKNFKDGEYLKETRNKILQEFGHHNFSDCLQNVGFTILGLLHGKGDFLKTIISAVQCGYDTDCTGATAGALLGIISGAKEIKDKVKTNDKVIGGWGIKKVNAPNTLQELTEQVVEIGKQITEKNRNTHNNTIPMAFSLPEIPEFVPPLSIPFFISEPLSPEGIEEAERSIIANNYSCFKKCFFHSMHFDLNPYFSEEGMSTLFLKTILKLREKKKIKIFPSSNDGVKLWLDRKMLMDHHLHNDFLPAPHRPGSPAVEIELEKGLHNILLAVTRCRKNLEFAWILADENNHLITDMRYEI